MTAIDCPVLEARQIDFGYSAGRSKEKMTLKDISFCVNEGEAIALLGQSGIGKTTLARICAGLAPPLRGEVLRRGRRVTRPSSAITVSFQSYPCFPWLTVERNLLFGLDATREGGAAHRARAFWLLQKVGLDGARGLYPRELSGGMLQRLSLARCLALEPDVLILDEPFSAVDQNTKGDLIELILELQAIANFSLLVILHDLRDAYSIADRVIVLSRTPATSVLDLEISGNDFGTFQKKVLEAMNDSCPIDSTKGSLLGLLGCVRAHELPSQQLLSRILASGSTTSVARRLRPRDGPYITELLKDRDPERVRLGILLAHSLRSDPEIWAQLLSLWSRSLSTDARFALVETITPESNRLESWIEEEAVTFVCEQWASYLAYSNRFSTDLMPSLRNYSVPKIKLQSNRLWELRRLARACSAKESEEIKQSLSALSDLGVPCLDSLATMVGVEVTN